ncbi:PTS mannitol transporter subunit IIA [Enterococcus gallinarum]|uniref:PTS sugar transporter subunit IIA n=1 Tax=Enterococcus gallinarum TaxID=1353 RepID=UPI0009F05A90|nr:PTS sugar transporter subunit IIA [Enterococcus gallinarum]OQO81133.1 PTS mannitol transporter subunit IIA [Enterococcus gallinarum]
MVDIPATHILLDQRFQSAEEALHEIGTFLVDQKMVQPQYINSLIQRHKKYGVYIGNFVALPHGEEEADKWINEEGICLVQVPDGVDFGDAKESKVTTILFVVVLKEKQLSCLQEIAFFCSDIQNIKLLSDAATIEEVQKILSLEE